MVIVDDKGLFGIYFEIGGELEWMYKKFYIFKNGFLIEIIKMLEIILVVKLK